MRTVDEGAAMRAVRLMSGLTREIAMGEAGHVGSYGRVGHSQNRSCPHWCMECEHDCGPTGAFWHSGPRHDIGVYGEASEVISATVRATFFDKLPKDIGTDPADLERPFVRLEVPCDGVGLSLTPTQARQLAAAINAATDIIECGASPVAEAIAGPDELTIRS